MPKTITDTTTFADLEDILYSFGLTLHANPEAGGRWLAGVTGRLTDGKLHTAATMGSTLAEATQMAVERWCTDAGDALCSKTTKPVRS